MCSRTALDHPALLYGSEEDFLSFMVPYAEEGMASGEPVFVAARADNIAALRDALGSSKGVELADTDRWHPHPANRLRAFHEYVSEQVEGGATAIRLAGEPVWPTGPPEFVREWQRYESILNAVLAPFPVTLICLYDSSRLDPAILAGARQTHRDVRTGGSHLASDTYEPPEELARRWNPPLAPPPPGAQRMLPFEGLSRARGFLNAQALSAGLRRERATDLCVAANEVLTNALVHGQGVWAVHTWVEADRFICQIEDRGAGVDDPLAGYRPPPGTGLHGYGLWLARQLVDLLQIVSGPGGTAVRLQVLRG